MEQDSDHVVLNLSLAPSNFDAAETPLGQDLPIVSSSSSPGSSASQGLSSSTTASRPTVAPSSSDDGLNLSLGLISSTVATFPRPKFSLGPSSSTDGLDLSLGSAAGSSYLGLDLSLVQPITSGSQVASSSQHLPTKAKAINLEITKITIGNWTQAAAHSMDLVAKCYFGKQQFAWEILHEVQTETGIKKQLKKMEIKWSDVLSLQANDQTGCLEIELGKPPTFFEEGGMNVMNKWQHIDQFTSDHPSSTCRHVLYFDPAVLKTNYSKIVADIFWAEILRVPFPSLPDLHFFLDGNENVQIGDNNQNATVDLLLGPQDITPLQQMNLGGTSQSGQKRNVPSPDPQVGPNLGDTWQRGQRRRLE